MNETHEFERIAELENEGYMEGTQVCPECGTNLMEFSHMVFVDDEGCVEGVSRECPYCGFMDVQYDD